VSGRFGASSSVYIGGPDGGHHRSVIHFHSTGGRWIAGRRHAYRTQRPGGMPRAHRRIPASYRPRKTAGRKRTGGYRAKAPSRLLHHAPIRHARSAAVARRPHHSTGLNALQSRRRNMALARAREARSARTAKQLAADMANLLQSRGSGGHRHGSARPSSARARAADRANLAKARAAQKGRPRSAKQLAASRASIKKAQAVARRLPRTAKQIAASRANIAKARAAKKRRRR